MVNFYCFSLIRSIVILSFPLGWFSLKKLWLLSCSLLLPPPSYRFAPIMRIVISLLRLRGRSIIRSAGRTSLCFVWVNIRRRSLKIGRGICWDWRIIDSTSISGICMPLVYLWRWILPCTTIRSLIFWLLSTAMCSLPNQRWFVTWSMGTSCVSIVVCIRDSVEIWKTWCIFTFPGCRWLVTTQTTLCLRLRLSSNGFVFMLRTRVS